MPFDVRDKSFLITGGTGSFGKHMTRRLLEQPVRRLVVFSRDELKQYEMQREFDDERIRFFLGDVRDASRLHRAFAGIDVVIHAAALKQVPAAEYNPFEAVKTNVLGAENVINSALDCGVKRVVALSTDKAANPLNLYGATKLCSDKLFIAGNSYAGRADTRFAVVRYGNVVGSRGSVIPLFIKLRDTGRVPVTDPRMTRFWILLDQGCDLVFRALDHMQGGEIFVPKIPSMNIMDLVRAVAPACEVDVVGIRPGEKLHEVLISEEDALLTRDWGEFYVIEPAFKFHGAIPAPSLRGGPVEPGFRYRSDRNDRWLSVEELRAMVSSLERTTV